MLYDSPLALLYLFSTIIFSPLIPVTLAIFLRLVDFKIAERKGKRMQAGVFRLQLLEQGYCLPC